MMRSLTFLLTPFAYLLQPAAIQVKEIRTTATQAVLVFQVPDTSNCSVRVTLDQALTQPVHDSNTALFAGAQDCGRPGSAIEGNTVTFVAGLRRAQQASDQRFYSRALEANREFHFRITSGAATYEGKLKTLNPPLGKAYGEAFPFDAAAPGHYAWPSVDWTDRGKEYIDPLTGIVLKRLTGPRMAEHRTTTGEPALGSYDPSGQWAAANAGAAIDGNAAVLTAATADPLYVRATPLCPGIYDCERAAYWTSVYRGIDDVQVSLKAWCDTPACVANAAGERDADVCLTVDGKNCATAWKTITVAAGSAGAAVAYPSSFPAPLFQQWLGGSFIVPLGRPDMATYSGTVNTNGTTVTWASGHLFPYDVWKAGSRLVVNNVEYQVAAVVNASTLQLATSAGVQTGVAYRADNFGVLIRKSAPSAEALSVDGVTFRHSESQEFEMTATGSRDLCSAVQVTDPGGRKGFVCHISSGESYPTLWFLSSEGDTRYLGQLTVPFNADTSGGAIDGNHSGCRYAPHSSNPNQFFCLTVSNYSPDQGVLLFRGTYHPEGRAGCSDPGGYQHISSVSSCLFTWELATKPSQNRGLLTLVQNFEPRFEPARFPFVGVFTGQGNRVGLFAWAGQDTMSWSFWLDADTLEVTSVQDYHSKPPCRFCAVHSFLELGDDRYNSVVVIDLPGGTQTGAGRYQVDVTGVDGVATGALASTKFDTCPADLPQKFKNAGAVGANCITVTVAGDPCDSTPSSWEQTHNPVCPWKANAVTMQPIIEGDEAGSNGERFLFVRKLSDTRWILLRNYNIPHGPALNERTTVLSGHPAGWQLTMACGAATDSGYVWVDYINDPRGDNLLRDNAQSRAQHGDLSKLGSVSANFDGVRNLFGAYLWTYPIPDRLNMAADLPLYTGRTFGNIDVNDSRVFRDFIQVHPSWRQVAAPPRERRWFLDGNPFAAQAGGTYTLWNQPSTPVTGSLYKLGTLTSPLERKYLATLAWTGRHLMQDVSGPGSVLTGAASDNYKYCVADFSGECVAGSAAKDIYINLPHATIDGLCGNIFLHNRPCFTSMVNLGIGINQYGAQRYYGFQRSDRYMTGQLQRYNATWTYDNAVPIPDGTWAVTSGSWLEGVRNDLLMFKIPPHPEPDSINRSDYIPMKIRIAPQQAAPKVRVRFGYAEHGPADSYYCTSRREACAASGSPFQWLSEAPAPVDCAAGCTVTVPGISGRVVYYVIDRLNAAGSVLDSGRRGALAVP